MLDQLGKSAFSDAWLFVLDERRLEEPPARDRFKRAEPSRSDQAVSEETNALDAEDLGPLGQIGGKPEDGRLMNGGAVFFHAPSSRVAGHQGKV